MRAEIARLQRELAVTTVYVTHDQVEAMTMGTRVAVLDGGRMQQVDTPQRLYDEPANLFVATFIGSPAMNLFPGRRRGERQRRRRRARGRLGPAPPAARRRAWRPARHRSAWVGRPVVVGIRPEALDGRRARAGRARRA